jgi:hypothetical protein
MNEQESKIRALRRSHAAAENRKRFPEISRLMDSLASFSPRLLWAREAGNEIGTRLRMDRADTKKKRGNSAVSVKKP